MSKTLDLARRFMACVEVGDVEGARTCQHADGGTWHNYDNVTQSVDQNLKLMQVMMAKCKSREYDIHRLEEIEGGYLQVHTLSVTGLDGRVHSSEACVIVTVKDDKIALIQEWIDPTPLAPLFTE